MSFNYSSTEFTDAVTTIVKADTYNWITDINVNFVLASGYLVFIMQLGFTLLTAGAVRAKSVRSICVKNIMDASFGGCAYFILGWGLAYGDTSSCDDTGVCVNTGNGFIGTLDFASITEGTYATFIFQWVFAIATATIVSGAVAERLKFTAYIGYATLLTGFVYPVLTHWAWSTSGWASTTRDPNVGKLFLGTGVYDTVGSGAVHMLGGVAGLAGAWVVGPRIGRFDENGKPVDIPGHNAVYTVSGTLLLWFGFYGFNPGTMGAIIRTDGTSYSMLAARCAISTTMGGCFGAVVCLLTYAAWTWFKHGKPIWCLTAACNGSLCGMIVITSGCGTFEPWASALGGIAGGLIYLPSSWFWLNICKIDDPVDAVTVHMVSGALGVMWESLLSKQQFVYELYGPTNPNGAPRAFGWWTGGGFTIVAANIVWVLVIFGWTMACMLPFFFLLKWCGQLRVTPEEEQMGADVSKHGGHAYPGMENVYMNEYDLHNKPGANGKGIAYPPSEDSAMTSKVEALEDTVATLTARLAKLEGTA